MTSTDHLVSVYIPTHRRAALLARALQSVYRQSHRPIEVLVCVDGPDPDTIALLCCERPPDGVELRVLRHEQVRGASATRNTAIAAASAQYVTGLDDDDEFLPNRIARMLGLYRTLRPGFVCGNSVHRSASGDRVIRHAEGIITWEAMRYRNEVGNQVLTETARLRELGGFDVRFPAWQDFDMWFRLARQHGSGWRDGAVTYVHYLHGGSRITAPERIRRAHELFVEKHAAELLSRHRRALELLVYHTTNEPIPPRRLLRYLAPGNLPMLCRVLVLRLRARFQGTR